MEAHTHMKKTIVVVLFLSLLLSLPVSFTACGGGEAEETAGAESISGTSGLAVESETTYLDTLGVRDFGGASYVMYVQDDTNIPILNMQSGEVTGEILNDTQYNRDREIEDAYNVKIEYPEWTGSEEMAPTIRSAVQSGDAVCDVFIDSLRDGSSGLGSIVQQGVLYNLLDVPHLSLDAEWWSPLMYQNTQYNGKMFFTSGDMAPFSFIGPACVYMNQNLAANYSVDEQAIYELVYSGKWTFDELYSRYEGLDTDLNGDGKMHCLDDFYGIVTEYNNLTSTLLLVANDVKLCETGDDGRLAIHLDDERTVAVIDKMAKYFQKIENNNDNTLLFDQTFKYDRALFAIHYVESTLRRFRDMESDYVILPMPKYDVEQESYVSYINPWVKGFISIPLTQDDIDKTGFITEVMEYKSVEMLRPAIYDVTLKGKALRNEDSLAMLDIVFNTTYIDFNGIYEFGGVLGAVNGAIFYDKPYISAYEKALPKAESKLDDFMKAFD